MGDEVERGGVWVETDLTIGDGHESLDDEDSEDELVWRLDIGEEGKDQKSSSKGLGVSRSR